MPSARSTANLKPWKKGQSGNPKGRPKGVGPGLKPWQDFALEAASPSDVGDNGVPTKTRDDMVMMAVYLVSINPKSPHWARGAAIWEDRIRGKTPDKVELGARGDFSEEENPISTVLERALAAARRENEKQVGKTHRGAAKAGKGGR